MGEPGPIVWEVLCRVLWRSTGGRFDLVLTEGPGRGYWVAHDRARGGEVRGWARETCAQWCERRKAADE